MKQLEFLEQELKMMLENIERIKQYAKDNAKYKPYNSHVVGEFKHRAIALKSRLTLASNLITSDIFKK